MKIPGVYQGAVNKWNKSRAKYMWDLVREKCPNIAARYDEVPNWLRERLGVDTFKGRSHGRLVPEVCDVVDGILKSAINDGLELTYGSIGEVLKDAIEAFNEEARYHGSVGASLKNTIFEIAEKYLIDLLGPPPSPTPPPPPTPPLPPLPPRHLPPPVLPLLGKFSEINAL